MQNSFSGATMSKVTTFHLSSACIKVGRAVQDAARIVRIMTFLHCAKDLHSVLKLYGIEDSRACQSPNET
jgi:hypothetical protein